MKKAWKRYALICSWRWSACKERQRTIIGDELIPGAVPDTLEAVVKENWRLPMAGNRGVGCRVKPRFSGAPHRDNGGHGRLARAAGASRRLPRQFIAITPTESRQPGDIIERRTPRTALFLGQLVRGMPLTTLRSLARRRKENVMTAAALRSGDDAEVARWLARQAGVDFRSSMRC